ncbi:MAG: molecular chaperone HtpG [Nitrospirae bacterium GWC2_57_13]|nr:MAG: molecular chaperone HtpG [Nitrospirae bacterium GWC1_57_7]OGW28964.1 MAG: molecular chaperone HtpG [Nitrospirae bacterium GWC2_57_13]
MAAEKMEFKTEVKELLNLMIHSLYSHKEIFLRELISNASDAIDKARHESLTNREILEACGEWKIKITPDQAAGTLTISDNGIGMTREEVVAELGTIAHSGTREFMQALKDASQKDKPGLIGQFGVGFYSAYMAADSVTVLTRKATEKTTKATRWESTADGTYSIDDATREQPGTDVVLHLRDDDKKYLQEWELRDVIRKYSDYIEHPVVMDITREKEDLADKEKKIKVVEEETLNSRKAIWLKDPSEIKTEEYNDFYKHVAHDYTDPAKVIHYRAEGTSEFTALLYIPQTAPYGILYRDFKIGPMLYVKRVQIMDHCAELIPEYLRFVRGVVDSSDLPLNVSREILQSNRQTGVIKKSVTKKVLDALAEMKKNDGPTYEKLYKEFGRVLKEGIHFDSSRKEEIADLLLFASTKTESGKYTTLSDYVRDMPIAQDAIYYIIGRPDENVLQSPYLEAFRTKGYEVLCLTDDIDDLIMLDLQEYKGKKIKNVIKGDVSLDKTTASEKEAQKGKFEKLLAKFKEQLKDEVKDVRLSGRLTDSASCLVADEGGLDPQMEKMLRSMGQDVPTQKRILEINPGHPVFETMNSMLTSGADEKVQEYIDLLYDQSLLLEGSKIKDPAAFARSVAKLMTGSVRGKDAV